MRLWTGAGVVGSAVVLGCNSSPPRCSRCAALGTPAPMHVVAASPATARGLAGRPATAEPPLAVSAPPAGAPIAASRPATPEPSLAVELTPPPPLKASIARSDDVVPDLRGVARLEPPASPEPVPAPPEHPTPGAESPATAYAHSPDYSWLCGIVEPGRTPKVLLLRYAAEDTDRFGGSVTLVLDEQQAAALRVGQAVRVEGALLDPDAAGLRPGYRVSAVKPLARTE